MAAEQPNLPASVDETLALLEKGRYVGDRQDALAERPG